MTKFLTALATIVILTSPNLAHAKVTDYDVCMNTLRAGELHHKGSPELDQLFSRFCAEHAANSSQVVCASGFVTGYGSAPAKMQAVLETCGGTPNYSTSATENYVTAGQCASQLLGQGVEPRIIGHFCSQTPTFASFGCIEMVANDGDLRTADMCLANGNAASCYKALRYKQFSIEDADALCSIQDNQKAIACVTSLRGAGVLSPEGVTSLCTLNPSSDAQQCFKRLRSDVRLSGNAAASICGTNPSQDAIACATALRGQLIPDDAVGILCSQNPSVAARQCLITARLNHLADAGLRIAALSCAKDGSQSDLLALLQLLNRGPDGSCLSNRADSGNIGSPIEVLNPAVPLGAAAKK